MGPKKKGKKEKPGSAKSKTATANPADLDSIEQLAKSGVELDILLKELQHSTERNDRLQTHHVSAKAAIQQLEVQLEMKQQDRLEITSDMSRQYKSMQSEMTSRIRSLEAQVEDLKGKLAASQTANQESSKEYLRILAIKDEVIEEQNVKMSYMSAEFESMLNETLAKMARKLDTVSQRWKENDNMQISEGNSRKLADFHLNRLIQRQEQHPQ
ncbi:hypothetical protein HDU78_011752 [Chytriomyces hyalinus]|uniref:Dynein regulatory complex protein 12 n=1 Tax=Chytriomyces confervae TaxID=246404 RepID=A0A507FNY6_9FUNG|nr:hypothetical protein HDU78_011752 [Chytriomyces hyalinus]KAJ3261924.1 hypothetical protein HDU77_000662 [Chytriomyces hyalinus]TPX77046.1 hypothetical protein CcCBS67573_g01695 [Chytriomyces confervae]